MSKKNALVARILKEVEPSLPLPEHFSPDLPLVEQGALLVLMRHMTQKQAEGSIVALRGAYEDWNEVRVCQVQEIAAHLKNGGRKADARSRERTKAAASLKTYLQEVFQKTHGLELEFLAEDIPEGGKLLMEMPFLGLTQGSALLWLAAGREVPVHLALVKFLDRMGLITRTTSIKKAQGMIGPLVPKDRSLAFTVAFHEAMGGWEDEEAPIFARVEVLQSIAYGKKAFQDWKNARARAEQQRIREEARLAVQREREERERAKEEARAQKRAEAEAKRRARELEKKRREEDRKRKAAQREAEAKAKAEKAAADKKEAAAKREAAKKAAAKKAAAQKLAAQKAAAKKKAATKKATAKKAAAKKAAAKQTAAKKAAAQKAAAKTKATAKKSASKTKSAAKKKTSTRKAPAKKKAAAKKATAKRGATRKKTTSKTKTKTKKGAAKSTAKKKPAKRKTKTSSRRR